jgi:mRNA interferase MazF
VSPPRLRTGDVVWLSLAPTKGREQSGHRPAVVVSGQDYLDLVDTLAMVAPVTSIDRGWPNHVPVTGPHGLDKPSWVMTEQLRTVSRDRITGSASTSICPDPSTDPATAAQPAGRSLRKFVIRTVHRRVPSSCTISTS